MFNLVKDDFDDNMDDIMKSINKMMIATINLLIKMMMVAVAWIYRKP